MMLNEQFENVSLAQPERLHPLRLARVQRGYSMARLAQILELGKSGQNRISEWEKGKHIPTLIFANRLASLYDIPTGEEVRSLCREWQKSHQEEGKK